MTDFLTASMGRHSDIILASIDTSGDKDPAQATFRALTRSTAYAHVLDFKD